MFPSRRFFPYLYTMKKLTAAEANTIATESLPNERQELIAIIYHRIRRAAKQGAFSLDVPARVKLSPAQKTALENDGFGINYTVGNKTYTISW